MGELGRSLGERGFEFRVERFADQADLALFEIGGFRLLLGNRRFGRAREQHSIFFLSFLLPPPSSLLPLRRDFLLGVVLVPHWWGTGRS